MMPSKATQNLYSLKCQQPKKEEILKCLTLAMSQPLKASIFKI